MISEHVWIPTKYCNRIEGNCWYSWRGLQKRFSLNRKDEILHIDKTMIPYRSSSGYIFTEQKRRQHRQVQVWKQDNHLHLMTAFCLWSMLESETRLFRRKDGKLLYRKWKINLCVTVIVSVFSAYLRSMATNFKQTSWYGRLFFSKNAQLLRCKHEVKPAVWNKKVWHFFLPANSIVE